jgi:hypothetical protein
MSQLEKLIKIDDLRTIWKYETDFSLWLAEEKNLKELSDAVGLNIVIIERESSVGNFSVDLFARDEITGRKIIIENQLENTDHDHLGKIITYAAGKSAEFIIWIVKKVRDEHRQAVEWLNQHTDENVNFFLIEIELWKIGDSLPAPKFNIVEQPNNLIKIIRTSEELSVQQKMLYGFWQAFVDYAFSKQNFSSQFSQRKVWAYPWYGLSVGNSRYRINLTVKTRFKQIEVSIYIDDNKEIFKKFKEQENEITKYLGMDVEFSEGNKDCRIITLTDGDITKMTEWKNYFEWFCNTSIKFKNMVKKFDV